MGTLREDQYTFVIISHSFLLRMRNVSDKNCRENKNTYSITVFQKSYSLWDNMEKYCRAGQATDDSTVHTRCMLDT